MKILGHIILPDRLPLLLELQPDRNHESWAFIARALFCYSFCYEVFLDYTTILNLLINASFDPQDSEPASFPTLNEIANHFAKNPQLLNQNNKHSALHTSKVREYLDTDSIVAPSRCIITDRFTDKMRIEKPFYVIDGMHRLVAFRLLTLEHENSFSIKAYYCTNKIS